MGLEQMFSVWLTEMGQYSLQRNTTKDSVLGEGSQKLKTDIYGNDYSIFLMFPMHACLTHMAN